MALMDGRNAVVFGVAHKRSIAWGITQALAGAGARVALNYQNQQVERAVRKLVARELPEDTYLAPCDVTDPQQVEQFFEGLRQAMGPLDCLVHCIAFAQPDELGGSYLDTSWHGYQQAHEVSAYSLVRLSQAARPLMDGREGAILSLSFLGAVRVVPGYNVMGVAKAALESSVRYLAADMGPHGTRVNAISSGPIKTLSAMGVPGFSDLLASMEKRAPLRRNVTQADVGNTALFLLSEKARGITGQVIYVDAGYSILGA